MSYGCPKCGSENTQKITSITSAGTTHSETKKHKIKSVSHTELAVMLAEPKKKEVNWFLDTLFITIGSGIVGLVAGVIGSLIFGSRSSIPTLIWLIVALATFIWFSRWAKKGRVRDRDYNQNQFPKEHALWSNGFYCHRCEHTYTPQAE